VTQGFDSTDTKTQILDVAERLVQVRGFNGFSYADVAGELGITKAALHYHFAGKAELGEALIERYAARFAEALRQLDSACETAPAKLAGYADLYLGVLREKRMCLCGMLAAEYKTLPLPMQEMLIRFFDDNESWLVGVLDEGRSSGSLAFTATSSEAARAIVGSLEGAMLVSRPYEDLTRFKAAAALVLSGLGAQPQEA
jgi:TetR/AcrR family transcriptional regulator, transcriptional repressor for nem operon